MIDTNDCNSKLHRKFKHRVENNLHKLEFGVFYSPSILFGRKYWSKKSELEHAEAECYLRDLVLSAQLPFNEVQLSIDGAEDYFYLLEEDNPGQKLYVSTTKRRRT